MQIRNLIIYPVKGLPGLEVEQAVIGDTGFEGDRRFMLVDASGRFISQREFPALTRFRILAKENNVYSIFHAEHASAKIEIGGDYSGGNREVQIWDDRVIARELGTEYNAFFEAILGVKCSLVYMNDHSARPRLIGNHRESVNVSFADSSPYLVLGTSSIQDLNRRVGQDLEWIRFRPNIIVETHEPYLEDELEFFGNENYRFHFLKKCGRCQVPNLNPITGELSKEPLRTLSEYRRTDNHVFFGSYFFSNQFGVQMKKGDSLVHLVH